MKTSNFIYGTDGSKGFVKKNVLNELQKRYENGQRQFTYTEIHDIILDYTVTDWRTFCATEKESRYELRGQFTGMFSNQTKYKYKYDTKGKQAGWISAERNCMCMPNQWDSRHLIKIKRGVYELSL